jgi:hypothetical protein
MWFLTIRPNPIRAHLRHLRTKMPTSDRPESYATIEMMRRSPFQHALRSAPAIAAISLALFLAPAEAKEPKHAPLANIPSADTDSPGATGSASAAAPSDLIDQVTYRRDGGERSASGRVLVSATDGGMLLQSDDGVITIIEGKDVVDHKHTERPFVPATAEEIGKRLLAKAPPDFRIYTTPHYVVCYDTSREYAQWTSSLLERLYKAFTNYWEHQKFELHEPEFPLVCLLFADRASYVTAAKEEMHGRDPGGIIGFYSISSNRVNMYDLTGLESLHGDRRGSMAEINEMLSQPAAEPSVATIVHEATHQIAFNCGLQTRFSNIPRWLCEGLAMYFETPDLSSSRGWHGIGKVNYPRLDTFQKNLADWQAGTLENLVTSDERLLNPKTAPDGYADAWALNYFLIKYHTKSYNQYMKLLSTKRPILEDDAQARLHDFKQCFGDLEPLERDFQQRMSRLN